MGRFNTLVTTPFGIGIRDFKRYWNQIILAGIGIGTGIRLVNFPGIGIKVYPESCITGVLFLIFA